MKAVAVCGRSGSGKSSLVARLSSEYGWDLISFGDYVRAELKRSGGEPTRMQLQALGHTLFRDLGPEGILNAALAACRPSTEVHLIDGIRHVSVWEAVRTKYEASVLLFLDIPEEERYRRYVRRRGDEGVKTYESFHETDLHPIEQGIDPLRAIADLVIGGDEPEESVLAHVRITLQQRDVL